MSEEHEGHATCPCSVVARLKPPYTLCRSSTQTSLYSCRRPPVLEKRRRSRLARKRWLVVMDSQSDIQNDKTTSRALPPSTFALGKEPRTSQVLSKHSATKPCPQSHVLLWLRPLFPSLHIHIDEGFSIHECLWRPSSLLEYPQPFPLSH